MLTRGQSEQAAFAEAIAAAEQLLKSRGPQISEQIFWRNWLQDPARAREAWCMAKDRNDA